MEVGLYTIFSEEVGVHGSDECDLKGPIQDLLNRQSFSCFRFYGFRGPGSHVKQPRPHSHYASIVVFSNSDAGGLKREVVNGDKNASYDLEPRPKIHLRKWPRQGVLLCQRIYERVSVVIVVRSRARR